MNQSIMPSWASFIPLASDLGKVAVLMGGRSCEREVSLMSGNGVLQALLSAGVDAHAFDPSERKSEELKAFDRCFIALHGRLGEDGCIQGVLEWLGIPYTGSGVLASSLAMNKIMTKKIWKQMGLSTPEWFQAKSAKETQDAFLHLGGQVMIVKPSKEGSTIGLTKVEHADQCEAAYYLAAQHDSDVLCEQFIQGEEVTCPVLSLADQAVALPIVGIRAPEGRYDYHNKYVAHDTQYLLPSGLSQDQEQRINHMVLQAYQSVGARGWGRVDVMIDQRTQQPYLLEINTSPGMTSHSLFPMSAAHAGLPYADLCLLLLAMATTDQAISQQAFLESASIKRGGR